MGGKHWRELGSSYRVILWHLLKWAYQRELRSRSWSSTISRERDKILVLETETPSLKRYDSANLALEFKRARVLAARETALPLYTFPLTCPWTLDQIRDPNFLPA
jgi:hypothetical protein